MTPEIDAPPKPFQFTLGQLMLAIGVVCLAAGTWYWLGLWTVPFGGLLAVAVILLRYGRHGVAAAIAVLLVAISLTALLLPFFQYSPDAHQWRNGCANNLHNIAIALQNYHADYGSFPPAYIADANGKPMHSWRVLILPYLEENAIYQQYDFNEPWDGPNNSSLAASVRRPSYLKCRKSTQPAATSYVAVVGPQTMWPGDKTTKMSDLKDGASNTIMLVEVHNSGIHWMEPRDIAFVPSSFAVNSPSGSGISSHHFLNNGDPCGLVLTADGQVHLLPNSTSPATIRAALTIAGGEKTALP
jgi:Protein of unknown function (DUF1559)